MNIPLCNRCPKPAFLRVDERTVLCAECWNITWGIVTDRMKADFENSNPSVSASSPDGSAAIETKPPNPTVAAVTSSDDGIPEFLRRTG